MAGTAAVVGAVAGVSGAREQRKARKKAEKAERKAEKERIAEEKRTAMADYGKNRRTALERQLIMQGEQGRAGTMKRQRNTLG